VSQAVSLDTLLEKTSRTFALSIPMLPEPTRRHVGIAYLMFRIADTFEDAVRWTRAARVAALADFERLLLRRGGEDAATERWLAESPVEHAGYLELLRETPAVIQAYWAMPRAAREVLQRDLLRTVRGMADVVRRGDTRGNLRLATLRELRDYCYVVAGIVGEMLTELFLLEHPGLAPAGPRLARRARFFGEGLQLVNILKDASDDATEGRVYLPEFLDRSVVFAIARSDLDRASEFVGAMQQSAAPEGLVAFTASPVILARASLDRIAARGAGAKLTRAEVGALMEEMFENLGAGREVVPRKSRDRT
jgi:farnesyl-diphosphate farnesyltransferase